MMIPAQICRRLFSFGIVAWLICVSSALAAVPEIRSLDIRGLTIGAPTTLTIDGVNLSGESRLVLPFAITQELKSAATASRAVFVVTVPADVVPGIYNLRIVNADGVSSPVVIGVDALPQLAINAEISALPVALHGTVGGSAVVEAHFPGKSGEEVTIEVEAARLGSKLRPVLHLLDAQRQQIGWAWTSPRLHGDARLSATLPADGVYTVTVHDLEFASPAPNHFRLKVGRWSSVDQVFPPVATSQPEQSFELLSPAGAATSTLPIPISTELAIPVPWPDAARSSGLRPWVTVGTSRELIEQPVSATPQDLGAVPVAVSGRIAAPSETDHYRLTVTPAQTLRFQLDGERLGSPLDGVLVLTNDQGGQLARGDDSPGSSDPVLEYAVPANVTSLVVAVNDAHGRGEAGSIYRLAVSDKAANDGEQGFRLLVQTDSISLLPGSRQVLPIIAIRNGYHGLVRIALNGLPEGIVVDGVEIPESADGTLLTLDVPQKVPAAQAGDATAAPRPAAQVTMLSLLGISADGQVTRRASFTAHPLAELQPWLSTEIALAVGSAPGEADSPAASFQIDWNNLPAESVLALAGKLTLPIQLTRPAGDPTPVRLSLVTSQNIAVTNGQPDLNKAVRAEAAVEIAADKLDGQLVAVIPPDLPGDTYDITVKAELLTGDKQAVLATAFAPVKRLNTQNPIVLKLAGELSFETTLDPAAGAKLVLSGTVERRAGMAGAVTVTLTGLPAGVTAAQADVKPEESAFELTVQFPAAFQPAELTGLELSGSGPPDPAQAGVIVKSKPVPITLKVKQP